MPYIGNKTSGVPTRAIALNTKGAFKFTNTGVAFDATMASVFCFQAGAGNAVMTFALYTDNAGAPNALVAGSTITMGQPSLGIGGAWLSGFFAAPVTIAAGTTYWLCVQASVGVAGFSVYDAAGIANQEAITITDALPLSDPYGVPTTYANATSAMFVEATSDTVAAGFEQQIII